MVEIESGKVDLMCETITLKNDANQQLAIRRSSNNERERPNSEQRHNISEAGHISDISDKPNIILDTNLEWLSLNWRKNRAQMISCSFRRLILYMHERALNYFPTLREIRDGLIKG